MDGFHRWQAHRREKVEKIAAIDLGNLTDVEIRKESLKRNSTHGRQLETSDKRKQAGELYLLGVGEEELKDLLSVTADTLETYLRDAKREEKERQQAKAWDLWLNCLSQTEIAKAINESQTTISGWLTKIGSNPDFVKPPAKDSHQWFDVWDFKKADDDAGSKSYFGRMPPQVVENLLWLYTEPGQIVFDPFAGGGTTIDVAKRMGRRVWSSDLNPSTPTVPLTTLEGHQWVECGILYVGTKFPNPLSGVSHFSVEYVMCPVTVKLVLKFRTMFPTPVNLSWPSSGRASIFPPPVGSV